MEFQDTVERSTELLRKALPLMSRQTAALHPKSYAVWYAYVADVNSALHQEVDAHLARHGTLDEAATDSLFRRHLVGLDAVAAKRMADGMQQLLEGMSASASQAGEHTTHYGNSLQRLTDALAQADAQAVVAPPAALNEVREHTAQMQTAMARLRQRLEDSQREISSLRDEVTRVRHESLVDALTGLANRRAFDRQLASSLPLSALPGAQSDGLDVPVCLVMLDIDHFKRVNDSYGHPFGDQVLRAVGQVLRTMVPEPGLAARVGGEEFALLLPGHALTPAQQLAEKIRATVAASRIRRKGADAGERITISLGVAQFGPADDSPAALVSRADRALYAAKQGGRDRVVVAD
jgi:diguanylate cyclase